MDIKSKLPWKRGQAVAERDPFAAFRRDMNALFDDFFSDTGEPMRALADFTPSIDVKDANGEVKVSAEMPGVDEKDVEVTLTGDSLTIKGEKKEEKEEKGEERYRIERSYGAFRRTLVLPCEVNPDKATASFKKGVLTITLPKAAAAAKGKKINVKAS